MRRTTASPGIAPSTNTGRVTSCPPRIRGVIIGPQHPGAVFPTIVPPDVTGPSIGLAGSKIPSVSSETMTVLLASFLVSVMLLLLLSGFRVELTEFQPNEESKEFKEY